MVIKLIRSGRIQRWFTFERAVRIFIDAVIVFAIIIAIGGWYLVDAYEQIDKAYQQVQDERDARRDQIDTQLGTIVCALVIGVPDDQRKSAPGIYKFVVQYHCPPYDPKKAQDFQPKPTPSPKKAPPTANNPGTGGNPFPSRPGDQAGSPTATSPVRGTPNPSRTSPGRSTTPTSGQPLPLVSPVCNLLTLPLVC